MTRRTRELIYRKRGCEKQWKEHCAQVSGSVTAELELRLNFLTTFQDISLPLGLSSQQRKWETKRERLIRLLLKIFYICPWFPITKIIYNFIYNTHTHTHKIPPLMWLKKKLGTTNCTCLINPRSGTSQSLSSTTKRQLLPRLLFLFIITQLLWNFLIYSLHINSLNIIWIFLWLWQKP